MVSPSFNDVRIILNTAQAMSLADPRAPVKLVTFDGDVTLYDDGMSLDASNPVIPRLLDLLARDIYVGIVTAAGYSEKTGEKYAARLQGLLDAINASPLTPQQKTNLLVMGGESNFLFRLGEEGKLQWVEPEAWQLEEVSTWQEEEIQELLNSAEAILNVMLRRLDLQGFAQIIRKKRGVGLVPLPGKKLLREQLEEVVLNAQMAVQATELAKKLQFTAFNGGSDVWVDIGDKRYGVLSLQRYLGGIHGSETLHVGDQFASVGANDFKARLAACTVWIASPAETVDIIEELALYLDEGKYVR